MSYGLYNDLTPGRAGLLEGLEHDIEGRVAKDVFVWGAPVFYDQADEKGAYAPVQDVVVMSLSGALVASNVITSTVTLNNVAFVAIATAWNTDHATTFATHIAAIHALTGVTCVIGTANQFTVTGENDVNVSIVTVVTLGASQATASYAYSTSSLVFAGVAPVSHREYWDGATGTDSNGVYPLKDMVNVVYGGHIWVFVPDGTTNTANKKAYVITNSDNADFGKFSTTATNNYDCGVYFKSNPIAIGTGNTIVLVEVHGIK